MWRADGCDKIQGLVEALGSVLSSAVSFSTEKKL